MTTEEELVELVKRAHAGESDAWGTVYETLAPSIYRLCRRALFADSGQDAEDATAEIFLKARLHLSQYDSSRPFSPWLHKIAANHCWDALRKKRTQAHLDDSERELDNFVDSAPSAQDAYITTEDRQQVRRAIQALDPRARLALVLRYYSEMSYDEIGSVLGISSNFVGVLLFRARRRMRAQLERDNAS